jgi:regulator of cell morphogenesis and NO signaling
MIINPQKNVADLVLDHSECASVLQRHRIDYCCHGDVPLTDACRERKLDVSTLVGELERAIAEAKNQDGDLRALPNPALVEHIVSRYHAPLRKNLPFLQALAAKVARVHGDHNPRLKDLENVVAELADTLSAHIDDEEETLFPAVTRPGSDAAAVRALLSGMRDEHTAVATLLERVRAASEDFTVPDWGCNSYRTLFRELERLETEILRHVHLENHVLLPRFA